MDPHIYQQMRGLEEGHWWFVGRRNIVGEILTSLDLPEHARILDAGCGTGGNLQFLSQQFGEVTGVELHDGAAALARVPGRCLIVPTNRMLREPSVRDWERQIAQTAAGQFDVIEQHDNYLLLKLRDRSGAR
ncbi:MAG: methyltransferase domain-containing protein [Pseudomonadota bacterium]